MSARRCPPALGRLVAASLLATALVVPVVDAPPAGALTTYLVTRTDDPAVGSCDPGDCSLREALEAANNDGDDSEITFGVNGTFVIADGNGYFVMADDGSLTVTGNGEDDTVISAQDGVGPDNTTRVFFQGSGVAAMTDLTVTGGLLSEAATDNAGAGILTTGTLSLTRVAVTQNTIDVTAQDEAHGAGIAAYGGSLTVTDSTVTSNTILGDEDSEHGAGIMGGGSSLTIDNSRIADNISSGGTAGVGVFSGTMSISMSTIEDNTALGTDDGSGGGVRSAFSDTSIAYSTIRGNSTAVGGGGLVAHGDGDDLTVVGTDFADNSGNDGPGGGVALLFGTSAHVADVTFTGNTAFGAGALAILGTPTTVDGIVATGNTGEFVGGAVLVTATDAEIFDAEISDNDTQGDGGAISVVDVFDVGGSQELDLATSTIQGNSAAGVGGGLFMGPDSGTVATASQITANGPQDCGYEDNGEIVQGGGSTDSDQTCFPEPAPDPGTHSGGNDAGNNTESNDARSGGTGFGGTESPATLPATGTGTLVALLGSAFVLCGTALLVVGRVRRRPFAS